jgi:hypothetical protein
MYLLTSLDRCTTIKKTFAELKIDAPRLWKVLPSTATFIGWTNRIAPVSFLQGGPGASKPSPIKFKTKAIYKL